MPQAPADRAPRLAARRELRADEVPAAAAHRAAPRSEHERSRSPCRRRLLTVHRDSLPVVRPTLRSSLPAVSSAPPSRPPPVRSALMRAVTLTRAPRTPSRTPSERRPSLSGVTARPDLLWCARGMRRSSWWPPGCLISTVRRPLTGRQVGRRAARARAPCHAARRRPLFSNAFMCAFEITRAALRCSSRETV